MSWSATGLPAGLSLDAATGQLSGSISQVGTYQFNVTASNGVGTNATRLFRLVIGDRLSLTPPLGWNSWNRYHGGVTDQNIRDNADAFISKGLFDFGYSYVNVDEGWQGARSTSAPYDTDHPGPLTGATPKFSADISGLANYIHSKGLKFGLYSVDRDPGYAGAVGGVSNGILCSPQDVQQMADWGADYLKYDGDKPQSTEYAITGESVRAATRDLVFTICSSSGCNFSGVTYYQDISNAWRIGYDLSDDWGSIKSTAFNGYIISGNPFNPQVNSWAPYQGPSRWLDADILVVGNLGDNATPSALLPDEQYVQVTQDAMLASPILAGCDLPTLADFTKGLLSNAEVLDVDQDPLGLQGNRVALNGAPDTGTQVWMKELEDGSKAVGLYNFSNSAVTVTANWSDLGITGSQNVRDLWRQQDLATFSNSFSTTVNAHGVVLVKITPADSGRPQITSEPTDPAPVTAGGTATLSVQATGSSTLQYQWYKNGNPISGANSASYTTPATTASDDGSVYRCTVSNGVGHVISYEVYLKVIKAAGTNLVRPNRLACSSTEGVYTLDHITDGDTSSIWGAIGADPQWVYADLGATYNISEVKLVNLSGSSTFKIQVAPEGAKVNTDNSVWTTIKNVSGLTSYGTQDLTGLSGTGRYVRFLSTARYGTDREQISEFQVYGSPVSVTQTAATPTFSPAGGTYTSAQTVTLSDTTPGATIYYTTDGSTPTASSPNHVLSGGTVTVSSNETIKAIAIATGYNASSEADAAYTINISGGSIVANGSFEAPSVGASNYQYTPTGASWTFAGNAGIQSNGSAWGASNAPNGTQAAFLQGNPGQGPTLGSITQSITFPAAGTYTLAFQAARRGSQVQPIQVSLDGTNQGSTVTPASSAFSPQSVTLTVASAGAHTIKLAATVNSGDNSTFIDQVTITPVTPTVVANSSFEAPSVGASNYQYTPTGASWTFAGNAGIQSNGSAWGASNAPDGTQTAFLQGNPGQGPTLGSITQSINFPAAGTYTLAFQAARRGSQVQPIQVSLDGTNQGSTVTPASSAFSPQSVILTVASAGAHTLKLAATVNSGDNSTFVDQFTITAP